MGGNQFHCRFFFAFHDGCHVIALLQMLFVRQFSLAIQ
jgi:hypothetical protein